MSIEKVSCCQMKKEDIYYDPEPDVANVNRGFL